MNFINLFNSKHQSHLTDIALLILRFTVGFLMLYGHGWRKLLKLFGEDPIKFADPFGVGMTASLALTVIAEVFCSFLLIIGLGTRLATIPLIIMMLTIIFVVHWGDPFSKTEFALLYMVPYVCILLMGAGRISIDSLLSKSVSR